MNDSVQSHEAIGGATAKGKPDPNVKVPPAVKAAADRADALSKQVRDAKEANEASGANTPLGPQGVITQNSNTQNSNTQNSNTQSNTFVTSNFDPKNPTPPTLNPPPAPQAPQPQDWEHQFNSLKGRYDKTSEDNRRMTQQITDMQRLMAAMNAPPPPQPQGSGVRFDSPIAGGQKFTPRVTDKERSEFGEETIDVMGRRAHEVVEPMLAQLYQEINQVKRLVGGVQNSQVFSAREQMYRDLAKEVPNWNYVNESPEFAQWLDQIDPVSRQNRRSFLNAAHNANVTGHVVDIFKGFLSDVASRSPTNGQGQQPGNGAAPSPQVDLASLVAPGRAKTGQTQVPPEKPYFNRADITQFYRDKTAGRYAGREAERDQIEQALFEAGREGRIR